jgi:hypothetical protein
VEIVWQFAAHIPPVPSYDPLLVTWIVEPTTAAVQVAIGLRLHVALRQGGSKTIKLSVVFSSYAKTPLRGPPIDGASVTAAG